MEALEVTDQSPLPIRLQAERINRRRFVALSSLAVAGWVAPAPRRDFDVHRFGAVGDGSQLDTAAIQKALDHASAAGGGARVLLRGGKHYKVGTLRLPGGVELHLADDATLVASTRPEDYDPKLRAILSSVNAQGLRITGTGHIDGQAMQFMTTYSETDERWEPKPFRPRMFFLDRARDLEVSGISFGDAPEWGLHLLGCERVLVDGIRIRNRMDVPNCDGIDPDHSRDVEIRNCDIVSADDAIVIKTSQQTVEYGPSENIHVHDCTVRSRDSGLKIGTETFGDIRKVLFERCTVKASGRGPTITHRQPGNLSDIEFRDITLEAEHHAARWWGWGEAISITVWPRTEDGHTGTLSDVRLKRITGRAENSVRIDGTAENPVRNVVLEDIDITIDKWTHYPGSSFDNRPTAKSRVGLEEHRTPAFSIRNSDGVVMKDCHARWGQNPQPYFSHALEAEQVRNLQLTGFVGEACHPDADPSILIR